MSTRLLPNLLYVMQWIFNRVNVQSIESVALGTFWTPIYEIHDVLDTNRLHWCRWGVFYFSVIWRWGESAYEQLSLWQSTGSARFLILFLFIIYSFKDKHFMKCDFEQGESILCLVRWLRFYCFWTTFRCSFNVFLVLFFIFKKMELL